ncbi:MAG: hypothetical protein M1352_02395, partial [Patescibacteria group bacterium]|nr:hypothetical protein [Patescibacteria group bacterium]
MKSRPVTRDPTADQTMTPDVTDDRLAWNGDVPTNIARSNRPRSSHQTNGGKSMAPPSSRLASFVGTSADRSPRCGGA